MYISFPNMLLAKGSYNPVFSTEIERDGPRPRTNITEDQTTFTTDTNIEIGHFVFCATSRTAPYYIP
jgi:hypothetical protein